MITFDDIDVDNVGDMNERVFLSRDEILGKIGGSSYVPDREDVRWDEVMMMLVGAKGDPFKYLRSDEKYKNEIIIRRYGGKCYQIIIAKDVRVTDKFSIMFRAEESDVDCNYPFVSNVSGSRENLDRGWLDDIVGGGSKYSDKKEKNSKAMERLKKEFSI